MREFLVRARKAPTDPDRFLKLVGREPFVEHLAQIFLHGLFVSQGHRSDTVLHLAMEGARDFPKLISIDGSRLGSLAGLHETALLGVLADALSEGARLGKEETKDLANGIRIAAISFEHFLKQKVGKQKAGQDIPMFLLDPKGQDIQSHPIPAASLFVLTDHIPMPKKSFNTLDRLGVRRLSLGPTTLHASQCITLIHNQLDRSLSAHGD